MTGIPLRLDFYFVVFSYSNHQDILKKKLFLLHYDNFSLLNNINVIIINYITVICGISFSHVIQYFNFKLENNLPNWPELTDFVIQRKD